MRISPGKHYKVVAQKIIDKVGVVVLMEDGSTHLVHISNIADCYVKDIAQFITVGEEYDASCEYSSIRLLQLSFKHLHLEEKAVKRHRHSS